MNIEIDVPTVKSSGFCINCDLCEVSRSKTCDVFPSYDLENETWKIRSRTANIDIFLGHSTNHSTRLKASSGGVLTEITNYLLDQKEVDYVLDRTCSGFRLRNSSEMEQSSAIYIEASYSKIIRKINQLENKRIAIIALPCLINPLKTRIEERNIVPYSFSLFCGHLKKETYKTALLGKINGSKTDHKEINFRTKLPQSRSASDYYFTELDNSKSYRMKTSFLGEWGSGPHRHNLCDLCSDAFGENADASFGDAWHQPYEADKRGTSIIIVRNTKIRLFLEKLEEIQKVSLINGSISDVINSQSSGIENKTVGTQLRWSRLDTSSTIEINHAGWWKDKYLFRVFLNKKEGSILYPFLLFLYFTKFVSTKSFIRKLLF